MSDQAGQGGGGLRVPGGIRTREALEARKPLAPQVAPPLVVPTLKGPLLERLRRAPPRQAQGEWLPGAVEQGVRLGRAEEVGAAALGLLLVEALRRAGGARASQRALQEALERTLGVLEPEARVAVEVEAYELLQWLAQALEVPEERAEEGAGKGDKLGLLQRAMEQGRDVELRYLVAGSKPELLWRRVTPWRVDAQKYLHAFCHHRQDERVFRLSRVDQVRLVAEPRPEPAPPPWWGQEPAPRGAALGGATRRATLGLTLDEAARADGQTSLLDIPAELEEEQDAESFDSLFTVAPAPERPRR